MVRDVSRFSHFTHNIQKSLATTGSIADLWGERIRWDAVSLQELVVRQDGEGAAESGGGGGQTEGIERRGIGRGGLINSHADMASTARQSWWTRGWRQGSSRFDRSPRTTAMTSQAQVTPSPLDRQIQIRCMHLPSCLRFADEEYDQYFVQCGSDVVKGHRRSILGASVDARTALTLPYPRIVGSLLKDTGSPPQLAMMAETLTQPFASRALCSMSTFSRWWRLVDTTPLTKDT